MKQLLLLIFLNAAFGSFAQKQLKDTVKINEVIITGKSSEFDKGDITLDSLSQKNGMLSDLGQLLDRKSPVYVKSYGIGSLATASLRGAGPAHTIISWNGFPLNSSMNGQVDLALFPLFFYDNAQVLTSSSSLFQNSGGFGGGISLNNLSRLKLHKEVSIRQDVFSFGGKSTQFAASFAKGKLFSETKLLMQSAENNFEYRNKSEPGFPLEKLENANLLQKGFMQNLTLQSSPNTQLGFNFWYFYSDRNVPSIFTVNNVVENQVDESVRFILFLNKYGTNWTVKAKSAWLHDELTYANNVANITSFSRGNSFLNYVEFDLKFKRNLTYKLRVNADFFQAEQKAFIGVLSQTRVSSVHALTKQWKKGWTAIGSFRQEWIVNKEAFYLPSLKLNYEIPKIHGLSTFIKWGMNAKYPSLNELFWTPGGNPELKAERAITSEWGVIYVQDKAGLSLQANLFYSEISNYIQWRPSAAAYWEAINLDGVNARGFDIRMELKSKFRKWNSLSSFNYTYTKSVNAGKNGKYDLSEGKQLIYLPEHQYNIYQALRRKAFSTSGNLQFMGARYITSDNVDFLSYYMLLDWSIGYQLKLGDSQLQFNFTVKNLLDKEYQAVALRPMPGRNYLFSLKYNFYREN